MKSHNLPSCSRCTHGIASVIRYKGMRRYSFAFRCSCPSGDEYPGLPLVPHIEQTLKERNSPAYPVAAPSAEEQRERTHEFFEEFNEIPF